ncbi:MAG: M50 family metallopeptidase [Planctomycetes bacterium]|nr:M50 family metallopeptidase [Planctomycetota bacterium]
MPSQHKGSFRIFRFAGVDVFLHWSWFFIVLYAIQVRRGEYSSPVWNVVECLGLFAIVTLHEFGHALACRSVGGRANTIVLWPLGGLAYVDPPQRPGPVLWSIAAGPLVNLLLAPVLIGAVWLARSHGLRASSPDIYGLLRTLMYTNIGLCVFNMLPIYPFDGGQILRAFLWFPFGRAHSLMIASTFGFLGVAALASLAIWQRDLWLGAIAYYALTNCVSGFKQAQALQLLARAPRNPGFACPSCRVSPPKGAYWGCDKCSAGFDTFETGAMCPNCGARFETTRCVDCGEMSPIDAWVVAPMAGYPQA